MLCDICGKEGESIRRITRSYVTGVNLLVIQNVSLVSCPNCGESYLTAGTLHEIDRIILHRQNFAVKRSLVVADFVKA